MNAKELRESAQRVLKEHERFGLGTDFPTLPSEIVMCEHILSTVRDDDDEPCNAGWLSEQTQHNIEKHENGWVFVQVDDRIGMFGERADDESWQIWCEEHCIGDCVSRGQFRSLCRGLGIELKEDGQ